MAEIQFNWKDLLKSGKKPEVAKPSKPAEPEFDRYEISIPWLNKDKKGKGEEVERSKEPEAKFSFREIQHQLRTLAEDETVALSDPRVAALQKERQLRLDQARKFKVISLDDGLDGVDAKIVQIQRTAPTLDDAAADISTLRPENFVYKYAPDSVSQSLQQELVDVVGARLMNARSVMDLAAMEAQFGPRDERVVAARRMLRFEGWGRPPVDSLVVRYTREHEDKAGIDAARKAVKAAAGPRAAAGGAPVAPVGPDTEPGEDELIEAEDGGVYRVPKDKNVPYYEWRERGRELKIESTFTREKGGLMDTYNLPAEIVLNVGPGRKARFKTEEFLTRASQSPTIADLLTKNRVALIEVFGADFMNGWAPLIEGSAKYYVGGFKNLTGDRETEVPAAMANFDFKETMAVLGDSQKIKTAMEIFIEMDGRNHSNKLTDETKKFLGDKKNQDVIRAYRRAIYTNADTLTHEQATEDMAKIQKLIAENLKLDEGSVRAVRTLNLFMGFGTENKNLRDALSLAYNMDEAKKKRIETGRQKIAGGYRKPAERRTISEQQAIYDFAGSFDNVFQLVGASIRKDTKPELALATTLDKSKAGSNIGILAKGYTEKGIDGLIDSTTKLDNGAGMFLTIRGTQAIVKSLETVDKMMRGQSKAAGAADKQAFLNAVLKELQPWTESDPPLIHVDTVEQVLAYVNHKKNPDDRGQLVKAAQLPYKERLDQIERDAKRDAKKYWF